MSKILVTGGAGFIGSHLVEALARQGNDVIVVDNLSSGSMKNFPLFVKFYKVDICEYDKLKEIFEKHKPEFVFHLAAQIDLRKSVENPLYDAGVNIMGSLNLLELAKNFNVKKFIFSSSGAVYGENELPSSETQIPKPESPYAISKFVIEKYLDFYKKNYGLNYVILRYSNVYGPRQNPKGEAGVVAIFLDKMLKNQNPEIFGEGLQTRDYVYVDDVIRANLLCLEKGQGIYNVSTCKETSVLQVFNLINKLFCNKFESIYSERRKGELRRSCLSYEKIKENLGWEPEVKLKEGILRTYQKLINNTGEK